MERIPWAGLSGSCRKCRTRRRCSDGRTRDATRLSVTSAPEQHEHHETMARRTTRGAAAMLAARIATNAITLASSAVVARILGPDAYGLVAMVTAVMAIAAVLDDFGLGDAAVQREHITSEQQSSRAR